MESSMNLDQEKVKEYIDLWRQKDQLKDQIEEINEQLYELENELLPVFKDGTQRTNIKNIGTVYLHRIVNASCGGDVPGTIPIMRGAKDRDGQPLDWLVTETINAGKLGEWVREFDPKKKLSAEQIREEIRKVSGDELADKINITEKFSLRVTRR